MPTPFLALNTVDGTTPQLKFYNGAVGTSVGVTFGALDNITGAAGSTLNNCALVNRAIQFGGYQTFYTLTGNQVYRSTNGGASWSSVFTLTSLYAGQGAKTGLYIIYVNGIPQLSLFWAIDTNDFLGATSPDGTTWTNHGPTTLSTNCGGINSQLVFNNQIYAVAGARIGVAGARSTVVAYDPGAGTISLVPLTVDPRSQSLDGMSLAIFNGNLMSLSYEETTQACRLSVLGAGVFVPVVTLQAGSTATTAGTRTGMFQDGAFLYCFFYAGSNTWKCIQVSSTYTTNDVSSSVLPPGMISNSVSTSRVLVMTDGEESPGSNPPRYLYYSRDANTGTSYTCYQWVDSSTTMTQISTGGSVSQAISVMPFVQGSTFWSNDSRHIELTNRAPGVNKLRLSFVLFSDTGSDVVNVRGWVGSRTDSYPDTAMTLSDPSAGSIIGNSIIGLTADNVTTYQVNWESGTDGFAAGDYYQLILEQYE